MAHRIYSNRGNTAFAPRKLTGAAFPASTSKVLKSAAPATTIPLPNTRLTRITFLFSVALFLIDKLSLAPRFCDWLSINPANQAVRSILTGTPALLAAAFFAAFLTIFILRLGNWSPNEANDYP